MTTVCIDSVAVVSIISFFIKQKTAYEMRITDWSSDVCSSDLALRIDAAGRTFVERHHDVAAEQALDFHGSFGGQHVARTVEVASERHPFLALLGQCRQAHHLIPAAVGQDRPVPAHEFVKPTEHGSESGRENGCKYV